MGLPAAEVREVVRRALAEDAAGDDVTTRWSVPAGLVAEAAVRAKEPGVVAGLPVAVDVFGQVDADLAVRPRVTDGDRVAAGETLLTVRGSARSILTGERTALNFLQRMCGIATLAAAFVAAVDGLGVRILDTRKTAPGLRLLDKHAVAAGGAANHRRDLAGMVLLKENHVAAAGGVAAAVAAVRPVTLEASGNVTLDTVRATAETGIDAVSVGALTHSVRALDLTLLLAA